MGQGVGRPDPGRAWHAALEHPFLSRDLATNLRQIKALFRTCHDLEIKHLCLPDGRAAALAYLDGLVNESRLDQELLRPLLSPGSGAWQQPRPRSCSLPLPNGRELTEWVKVVSAILDGGAVLFIAGAEVALTFLLPGWEKRSIEEPETEPTIRGPRKGFVEELRVNTALIRSILRTPDLKFEERVFGTVTRTRVALVYIDGLIRPGVLREVRARLRRIRVQEVLDAGYLEEHLESGPVSLFPTMLHTQRPDVVAAHLLEGRFAIITAGSPDVLIAPVTFWSYFQASDDHYERYWFASFLRCLRVVMGGVALLLPGVWVALLTFHQELIPTPLALTAARAREGVPFPAVVEAFIIEIAFEALREAGLRLPKVVGQAVSIVGALVIGEAAVRAGIISAPQVIIVATTAIASFGVPRVSGALPLRLLRFPVLLAAGAFGLYGITIVGLFLQIHLAALRSFGMPYLSPWTVFRPRGWLDFFVRAPRWLYRYRPPTTRSGGRRRHGPGLMPQPPDRR